MKHIYILTVLFSCILFSTAAKAQNRALVLAGDEVCKSTFEENGFTVNAVIGNIYSLQWKGDQLARLRGIPGVRYVETGTASVPNKKHDSLSRDVMRVSLLQNSFGTYGFDSLPAGKGVIIGIVDVGFQPDHPAFKDKTGTKNRVVRFWDQRVDTGAPPAGYNYGTLHTNVTGLAYVDSSGSHGTHVAGIAAGSGYQTPNFNQAGVATEAELVWVNIKNSNDTIPEGARSDYLLANPSIIDGFDYIFKYADSVGKPAVINLSWGMHTGPHDGTSLFDQALDGLVGAGKIIVGSAGNERGRWMHFNHNFSGDTVSTWAGENVLRSETFESIYVDFWGSPATEFSLQMVMVDSGSAILGQSAWVSSKQQGKNLYEIVNGSDTIRVSFECDSASVLNGKPNILVNAYNNHPLNSYMVLRATSLNASLNGWNSGGVDRYTSGGFNNVIKGTQPFGNMKAGNDNTSVGENGGTAERVITVGAYATSFTWLNAFGNTLSTFAYPGYLANFSSQGPTVDGRTKPDVVAPGVTISSAFNRYAIDPYSLTYFSTVNGRSEFYGAFSGTSMAAPQVSGIVALMLEQNPALTPETVRSILQQTAVKDTFVKTTPNNLYGWGKVDALAALQAVKGNTGINDVSQVAGIQLFPNPSSDIVKILPLNSDIQIIKCVIYSIEGKLLREQAFSGNETAVPVKDLATGVYLLQIETTAGNHALRFIKQ